MAAQFLAGNVVLVEHQYIRLARITLLRANPKIQTESAVQSESVSGSFVGETHISLQIF